MLLYRRKKTHGKSKCRWQDKIKANLKEKEGWLILNLAGSGTVEVARFCEKVNGPSVSIK